VTLPDSIPHLFPHPFRESFPAPERLSKRKGIRHDLSDCDDHLPHLPAPRALARGRGRLDALGTPCAGGDVLVRAARTQEKKFAALRLERFRMHGAIFALGIVLGAYQATKDAPSKSLHSSAPPPSAKSEAL
jgi:hypothetical protein